MRRLEATPSGNLDVQVRVTPAPGCQRSLKTKLRGDMEGVAFILPYGLFWLVFTAFPVVYGFWISLHQWSPLKGSTFVGLANYARLLQDGRFYNAFANTMLFAVMCVPLIIITGLAFALVLRESRRLQVRGFAQAGLFVPYLLSVSVVSLVWKLLLDPDFGPISYALQRLGFHDANLLNSPTWVLPALAGVTAWWLSGYRMVVFQAALEDIPLELYEAARIDGAGFFQQLRYVTLPLMRPAILFAVVLSAISGFRTFGQVLIMTDGGPGRSSEVAALYLYRTAFQYLETGLAAAAGFVLFAALIGVTLLSLWRLGKGEVM